MAKLMLGRYNEAEPSVRDTISFMQRSLDDNFLIYHNLSYYPTSSNKVEGEIDIVILNKDVGLLVIEVKGGRVMFDKEQNKWFRISEEEYRKEIKNPLEQAKLSCYNFLIGEIKKKNKEIIEHFPIDYAVMFPDAVDCECTIPDYEERIFCLKNMDKKEFKEKIENLLKKRRKLQVYLNDEEYIVIQNILAPVFKLFYSPETGLDIKKRLNRLTKEQAFIKSVLLKCQNKRFLIKGYAGTGKTYLAYEILSYLVKEGKKVLYICNTKNLANHIELTIENDSLIPENLKKNFQVFNFHKLDRISENLKIEHPDDLSQDYWDNEYPEILEKKLNFIFSKYPKFDAIFVDEGQNFKKNWWKCIEKLLKEDAYFYIFYDPYQSIFGKEQETIEEKLPFLEPVFTLEENLRNQKKISEKVEQFMNIEYKYLPEHPIGKEVQIIEYDNENDFVNKVNKVLKKLIKESRIAEKQIVLLSYTKDYNKLNYEINIENKLNYEINIKTLKGFIGLEAPVVLIKIDNNLFSRPEFKNDLYMGITRAVEMVYLFISKDIYKQFIELFGA